MKKGDSSLPLPEWATEDGWDELVVAMKAWVSTYKNDFPQDGMAETIGEQLQRGEIFSSKEALSKCIQHISMELEHFIRSVRVPGARELYTRALPEPLRTSMAQIEPPPSLDRAAKAPSPISITPDLINGQDTARSSEAGSPMRGRLVNSRLRRSIGGSQDNETLHETINRPDGVEVPTGGGSENPWAAGFGFAEGAPEKEKEVEVEGGVEGEHPTSNIDKEAPGHSTTTDKEAEEPKEGTKVVGWGDSVRKKGKTKTEGGAVLERKSSAGSSMMERQQEWLKKKQEKAEAERQKKENELESMTFAPKLVSKRNTSMSGVKSKVAEQMAQRAIVNAMKDKGPKGTTVINSKQIVRSTSARGNHKREEEADGKLKKSSTVTKKRTITKKRSSNKKKEEKADPNSLLEQIKRDLLNSTQSTSNDVPKTLKKVAENPANQENVAENGGSADGEKGVGEAEVAVPQTNKTEEETIPPIAEEDVPQETLPAAERIGFKFATVGTTDYKARFNIQPANKFEMNSIYRKRDKGTMEGGVSLMVGVHEESGQEEAIAVFFDRSKFDIDQAAEWWLAHQHRFNYRMGELKGGTAIQK